MLARCRQEGLRQEKIFDLVLPHRPEFLRRAGRLLESPDWKGWRLLRAWLMWLLDELRNRGFEVVILDNAPGISTTYTIMNLVWGLNGSVSVGDRAVCVVSSPRISDIVNTAYELLWLQAADWTQSRDTEEKRRVYWTGNMWAGLSLEEMIEKNTLPFLFTSESEISADPLPIHGCARMAHRFAGLTDDDLKRIEAVLRAAVERKRVIPSSVQYREDIRKLFDFDVTDKGLQGLNKIVSELATREPLRTLLQQKSEGKS